MNEKDLLVLAWGIIANVGNGDWSTQTADWQTAATSWRDKWYEAQGQIGRAHV